MKKLTKLLCAALVWALLLGAAVSCAKQPDSPVQDPPQQEEPQPAPELKIAVDSDPARSAVIHWFYSEEGQALFGDTDLEDVLFSVDPRDIAQELKLGNYDAAVCAPDQKALAAGRLRVHAPAQGRCDLCPRQHRAGGCGL